MTAKRFAPFAWFMVVWNLIVIMWGGYVRASGSGAGCGAHWPVCNGEIIPPNPSIQTLVEYSHRLTSGVALIGVLVLLIWAFVAFPKGNRVRRAALASAIFLLIEAAIGAGLVLLEYVAYSEAIARAYWMVGHLINTFMLTASLVLTAWWGSGKSGVTLRGQGGVGVSFWVAFGAMLVLAASGGIAALGDTLAIGGGISPAESTVVSALVQLRVLHPIIAVLAGLLVVWFAWTARTKRHSPDTQRFSTVLFVLFGTQLVIGALNVTLMAPVWMQMVHLFVTNLIWMTLILLGASALATSLVAKPTNVSNYPISELTANS